MYTEKSFTVIPGKSMKKVNGIISDFMLPLSLLCYERETSEQ